MYNKKLTASLGDHITSLLLIYNTTTNDCTYANIATKELLGYHPNEFLTGGFKFTKSLIHPDDQILFSERYKALLSTKNIDSSATAQPLASKTNNFEHRILHKDGSWHWFNTEFRILGRSKNGTAKMVLHVSYEITQYKKEEEQELFQELINAIPQIVWTATPDGRITYQNKRWHDFTKALNPNKADTERHLLHPDDIDHTVALWEHSIQTGEPYQAEYRFKDPETNNYRWFLGRAIPIRNEQGTVIKWYGTSTDINEQKITHESLRESELRYRSLVEAVQDYAIFRLDTKGYITSWNEGIELILGYTESEIVGKPMSVLFYPARSASRNSPERT